MYKSILSIALMSSLSLAGGYIAPLPTNIDTYQPAPSATSTWKHQVSIYGWVAIPDATITYIPPSSPDGDIPNDDGTGTEIETEISSKIDGVFMGSYEGRNDKYSVLFDIIYLGLSSKQNKTLVLSRPNLSNVPLQAEEEATAWLGAGYIGYNIINNANIRLDVVGGIRYASVEVEATIGATVLNKYRDITLTGEVELWDGVIGIDGEYTINKQWYMPYQFDIGAGDSDMTLRASLGLGYRFDWGDVLVSYRHLEYDLGDSGLMEDIEFSGPLIGVGFRF